MRESDLKKGAVHRNPDTVHPADEYDRVLIDNVRPHDWVNPEPAEKYNLVVVGAGTAGLVTAAIAAGLGAKVALIERHLMGGDCLNVGCVPSKGMIRASRALAEVRGAAEFGVGISGNVGFDFGASMSRMRRLRARISRADSAMRYRQMGVDVFIGEGRFTASDSVEVSGKKLRFAKAAICTGARAAAPPINGLKGGGYLTNETVFDLTALPARLAVIGGGPFGCELAQSFARFGSRVSLFERTGRVLPREDAGAALIVQERMMKDGVRFLFESRITGVEVRGNEKVVHHEAIGERGEIIADEILVGVGRLPNVDGLGLEEAGVEYDLKEGIKVNARLQTTNRRIYAAGDVCFPLKFTHTADALARIVVQNALFPHPLGLGYAETGTLVVPWCTYTDPEIAHVGMNAADAEARGIAVETFSCDLNEVDRAVLDGDGEGFARIHVQRGTDRMIGATLVAAHAGEMIGEITLAMRAGLGLGSISRTIHPYPTRSEAIRKAADAWRKTTLTEKRKKVLGRWFAWTR